MGERSKLSCVIPGCPNRRKRAGGLCSTHHRHAVAAGERSNAEPDCSVNGCTDRKHESLPTVPGYCMKHHKRVLRTGTTDEPIPYPTECTLPGCSEPYAAAGMCNRHYQRQWARDHPRERERKGPLTYECKVCGETFDNVPGGRRVRCPAHQHVGRQESRQRWIDANPELARQCRLDHTARWRAAHYLVPFEPVDRLAVFERDDWTCQLCGYEVDPAARKPDPHSASLDHIIPLSKNGHHTYANSQLACLICNQRKNATLPDAG